MAEYSLWKHAEKSANNYYGGAQGVFHIALLVWVSYPAKH
jgi:hypothetical protein